jgi:hypothetical protein
MSKEAGFYWYISKAKLDLLKEARPGFLSGVAAKLEFKLPFVGGSLSGTQTYGLVKDLKRVIKSLEAEHTVRPFEELLDGEAPVFVRFEGAAMRRVEGAAFWLAMERDESALLLAGSAGYAIGQPAKSDGGLSASVDPVRAIMAAFREDPRTGNLSDSLSMAWREILRDAPSSGGTLPRVEGLAVFARSVAADHETMRRAGRPRIKRIVVGTPLYVRQI